MALSSPRFAWNHRLQKASENNPYMRRGERGEAVRLLQQGLIDVGYRMPRSTARYGSPDGIYGDETVNKVYAFQRDNPPIGRDGIAGRETLGWLDTMLLNAPAPRLPPLPMPTMYVVPGLKTMTPQPSWNTCWATVHMMMRSWKDGVSYDIRDALTFTDPKYLALFDNDQVLPTREFGPFIRAAGMQVQPMTSYFIEGWVDLLRLHGLLWVGTMHTVSGPGLHSRILEGVVGDGTQDKTWMMIIDPEYGTRYQESWARFEYKYRKAMTGRKGEYFQVRHF